MSNIRLRCAVAVSEVMIIFVIADRTCMIGVTCSRCTGKIIKKTKRSSQTSKTVRNVRMNDRHSSLKQKRPL